jgi:hypothetical protein
LHYHLFRHSSATYYADRLNRQQLCIRYGWAFSSDMPDVYIARTGVDSVELEQKFSSANLNTLKTSLDRLELANKTKEERIRLLETTLAEIQQHFDLLVEVVRKDPSAEEVRQVLRVRRAGSRGSEARTEPNSTEWSEQ